MLTKDECEWAMVNLNDPDFVNEEDIEIFSRLIDEHFNQKPLLPKDLKIGMYVWDNKYKEIGLISYLNAQDDDVLIEYIMHEPIIEFQDDRFYPIIIPKED